MKKEKIYLNIKEVSKLLNIKEHVIRHWDSIDPKTNKIRFEGLSTRSKGGTRYFNKDNIQKLYSLKNILFENGKHNYSLNLANKILLNNKKNNFFQKTSKNILNIETTNKLSDIDDLKIIIKNLNNLLIKN